MTIEKINFEQHFQESVREMKEIAPDYMNDKFANLPDRKQKIIIASNLVDEIYHSAMADFICEFWVPGLKIVLDADQGQEIVTNVRRESNGRVWCDINGKPSIIGLTEFTQDDLEFIMTYLIYKVK